ncbi:MAG: GAF domain-containing protein, partial [Blastocatellia bacterium]
MIRTLSSEIGSAIHQNKLSREAGETSRRETLIAKILGAIHSSLDRDTVLLTIVKELGRALEVCRCDLVVLQEPMPERLHVEHSYAAPCCEGKESGPVGIPVAGNQHIQTVIASDMPVAIDDVDKDPAVSAYGDYLNAIGAKSVLAAPIRLAGKPIGVISLIQAHNSRRWARWEIDLLQSLASQAAIAIRQADLYREARESATRAALLNQIFGSIRRSLDLDEILQVAVRELGHALNASRVVFRKLVADDLVVSAEYLENSYESLSDVRDSAAAYNLHSLAEARRTLVIDDVKAFAAAYPDIASRVESWGTEGATRSEIVCPIFVNYAFWGALSIHQTDRPRRWTPGEIAMVEAVTAQIEIAVSHSRLFEEATGAARREALIGRIINGINQSNHVDQILPLVARELADYLGCDSLSIVDHRPETDIWTSIWQYSRGEISRPGTKYSGRDFPLL